MPPELLDSPLFLAALALAALGVVLGVLGLASFMRLEFAKSGTRLLLGLLMLALGALSGTVAIGVQGYRALTHEEVAARISVKPAGPQHFTATFRFPDGREATYELAGDAIYVDAHVLKWHPYANWAGLHTAYELDRVSGRYQGIKDEREEQRTVHELRRARPVDLLALRKRYAFLAPAFDTEYGSASFVAVNKPAELELRVSTTGLLIREAKPAQKP